MVHSSPANAWFLRPEIERLSRDYTVFAFDTPGFGLSQALPLEDMLVADLADALDETLTAIGMPPCPVFGSHSGAAIALEFGVRHPERVTGLVLDGVPAFSDAECAALFEDYFHKFPVSDLGGHYSDVWTRFRDQAAWFPWSARAPQSLNGYDLSRPDATHLWVSMYFEAADTYIPAYRAASHYGARALAAAAELDRPAIYTATDTDMLFPHLARLPPLKPGQEIRRIGTSLPAKHDLIAEGFARFGSPHPPPDDCDGVGDAAAVARQFLDGEDGRQVHIRYAGRRAHPAVLLLHDGPGSAEAFEPLMAALSDRYFVIAPDLPGAGESDPFQGGPPALGQFAGEAAWLLQALGAPPAQVYGLGFGASVAVELGRSRPDLVAGVVLGGLLAADALERARLAADYTPDIAVEPDGAHWYRTWLMLRDGLVWWPWYDRRQAAQRAAAGDFGAARLHRRTMDVMRRRETYGHLAQAALGFDAMAALASLRVPVCRLSGAPTPLDAFDGWLATHAPQLPARPAGVGAGEADALAKAFDHLHLLAKTTEGLSCEPPRAHSPSA